MELKKLIENPEIVVHQNVNLDRYTTTKLSVVGSIVIVSNVESLVNVLCLCKEQKLEYHLVGWGSNQILHNTTGKLFIKLDFKFERDYLKKIRKKYILPASVPLNILTSAATKLGIKGWDVFTGIPASLGGAVYMNAGTSLGEIGDLVESVRIIDADGNLREYICNKNDFEYRKNKFVKEGEIIVSVTLLSYGTDQIVGKQIRDYLQYRKDTQPLSTKNCGSVFKNNKNIKAGITIDKIGLKGFGVKKLMVSHKHANFIENRDGGATPGDFVDLTDYLKDEIERYSGIQFELEVKVY